MLKEVTKEEAVTAAIKGQDAYMIYGEDTNQITNLNFRLQSIFNVTKPKFLVDVPEEKPKVTASSSKKNVGQIT